MSRFPHGMTVEEQKAFLTDTRLWLARDIRRTRWAEGVFTLRHMPTGRHLRVSPDGLYILGLFGRGATVAEVLTDLLKNRRSPSLRTFYAFIVEARDRNILVEDPSAMFPRAAIPRRWPSLPPMVARWLLVSGAVAAVGAILFQPGPVIGWGRTTGRVETDLLLAYALLSLSVTIGSLLASATVLRLGGEVRWPTFLKKTWLPRVRFDWSDCEIGGPDAIAVASLLRLVPTAWLALVCVTAPALRPLALPVTAGLLLCCGPLSGPVRRTLCAKWREPLRRIAGRKWFFSAHLPSVGERLGRVWKEDSRHTLRLAAVCLGWCVAVIALMGRVAAGSVFEPFVSLRTMGPDLLRVSGIWMAIAALGALVIVVIRRRAGAKTTVKPAARAVPPPPPSARALFEVAPLFRSMPPEVVDDLARGCRVVAYPPDSNVVGLGETGEELYVVRSGEFEVLSRNGPGDDTPVMRLLPGDAFGETPVFDELLRPRNIRALGRAEVLVVTAPELQQTLMRHLSVPVVEEIVLKRVFFRELPLLRDCAPRTVEEICRLSRFENVEKARVIGLSGRETRHFSFVFTGGFRARYRDRDKDALPPASTFGEVSMLAGDGDDEFVATIPSRRLVVGRDDFLPLAGRDPELALRLEAEASHRIGRPVLPYAPPPVS